MPEQGKAPSKKLNIWLPLLFSLVLIIGMIIGARLSESLSNFPADTTISSRNSQPGTLEEMVRFIDAQYVDDVDSDSLSEEAMDYILDHLDPHSSYISPDRIAAINEQMDGNFIGVGIEFLMMDDTITIIRTTKNGPSEKAGLKMGDQIISIEDSIVAGINFDLDKLVHQFRGKLGTKVKLGIKRKEHEEIQYISVTRDIIGLPSVDIAYEIAPDIGFIKINRFSSETSAEFIQSLEKLVEKDQVSKIIIDLRDNPGGVLMESVEVLSQLFAEQDKLLVFTEGAKSNRLEYKTTGRPFYQIKDVAVLINEGSASASEIVAGAIQDWDRGHVIGRRTYGKGLVQEQYRLRNGGGLRLTVARYFTPSGRCIQKTYSNGEAAYNATYDARVSSGELFSQDSIKYLDTTAFRTPSGRIVFGGGGIAPDYFIPMDSLQLDPNFLELSPYVQEYAFRYVYEKPTVFDNFQPTEFVNSYRVSDETISDFIDFAKDAGANKVIQADRSLKRQLSSLIKAEFARIAFDDQAMYEVLNQDDPFLKKAITLLRDEVPIANR